MSRRKQPSRQSPPHPSQPRKWYTFESLIVARLATLSGFVTGVIGCLDWSPFLGLSGFDRKQVIFTGGIVLLIGISSEVSRRMNNGLAQP